MAALGYDPYQATATLALSGSNLIVTNTAAGGQNRSIATADIIPRGTKVYWEVKASTLTTSGSDWYSGFKNRLGTVVAASNFSRTTGSLGIAYCNDGSVYLNNSTLASGWPTFILNDVIEHALDEPNGLYWTRKSGANWNNNVSADPATGTLGIDVSSITGLVGALSPAWNCFSSNNQAATYNAGDSAFTGSVPSGFSSLTSVLGAVTQRAYRWNSGDASANIRPFNDGLTALAGQGNNEVDGIRCLVPWPTGPRYIEFSFDYFNQGAGVQTCRGGMATLAASLSTARDTGQIVVDSQIGSIYVNGVNVANGLMNTLPRPCIVGIATRSDLDKVWWQVDGGNWNSNVIGAENPVTGAGGISMGAIGTTYAFAQSNLDASPNPFPSGLTMNPGYTSFAFTKPTGFYSHIETIPTGRAKTYIF